MKSYEVIKRFKDKYSNESFNVGTMYISDDEDRVEELHGKGYLSVEQDTLIKHVGGGYYVLSNGEKVRGKEKALEALKDVSVDE
ncbi:hypothetical protein [Bacillus sp. 2205SS5-2]|uniref:hypothetical protein n=1 Tax=Bacillus sp. 2205SS5-2 TaxID=3109031 RepID=UPI003003C1D9